MLLPIVRKILLLTLPLVSVTHHSGCGNLLPEWMLPTVAHAAGTTQPFDLDISVLSNSSKSRIAAPGSNDISQKKPSPAKLEKKTPLVVRTHRKPMPARSKTTVTFQEAAAIAIPSGEKLLLLKKLPSPDTIPTPSPSTTLVLNRAVPPCELIPKILVAFSTPISTAEALHGVPLAAPYALRHKNVVAAIACGLAEAEELTFSRLLADHSTKLINIIGNDTPETVVNKITDALELSSQLIRISPYDDTLIYIFPADNAKEKGLFISLTNDVSR